MPVLDQKSNSDLFRAQEYKNLTQQFSLLDSTVTLCLQLKNFSYSLDVLNAFQRTAAEFISHEPGKLRDCDVHIVGSSHKPPRYWDVQAHLIDFFNVLNDRDQKQSSAHLAAYAMWRIAWIHPYEECNGRAARAFSYFVFCMEEKFWLPGAATAIDRIMRIKSNHNEYLISLYEADEHFEKTGCVDVSRMEAFIRRMIYLQIRDDWKF